MKTCCDEQDLEYRQWRESESSNPSYFQTKCRNCKQIGEWIPIKDESEQVVIGGERVRLRDRKNLDDP